MLSSRRSSSLLRRSARAQEIGQVAGVRLLIRAETCACIAARDARDSGLGLCPRGGTRTRSGRDGLWAASLRLCGFCTGCSRFCRHAVRGSSANGAWGVVCRWLLAAEEFDERLFLRTLVLARESAEYVVFVFVIFGVRGHGVGVFVAVARASAACISVGVCGSVS